MKQIFANTDVKRGSRANEFLMNCPFCLERTGREDTKHHLGFNTKSGKWNCFRCGAKTSTHGNLKKLENVADFYGNSEQSSVSDLRKKLANCGMKKQPTNHDLELMSWRLDERETPFAYNYMKDRGFSDSEMVKYHLRVGHEYMCPVKKRLEKKWKGRVLFPFLDNNGDCIYIVGRSYLGHDPKYRNSQGSKKSVVYGLDKVNGKKECIITEGLISAIAAERATGIPAVCLLGKSNSNWALSKIRSKTNRIYLSLDGGITEGTANLKRRLINLNFEVFEIILPADKDPDDLGDQYIKYFNEKKKISFL